MPTRLFSVCRNSTPRGGKAFCHRDESLYSSYAAALSVFCLRSPPSLVSVKWMFSAVTRISKFTFEIFVLVLYEMIHFYFTCAFTVV